jgi:hypothetical protein
MVESMGMWCPSKGDMGGIGREATVAMFDRRKEEVGGGERARSDEDGEGGRKRVKNRDDGS